MMRWRRLALPLALMAFIAVLSSVPGVDDSGRTFLGLVPPALQNLLHVPLFALLAWSWCRALMRADRRILAIVALAATISFGWGVLDEYHQLYVPGRYASLTDLLLNGLGVGLGSVVFAWRAARPRNDR